MSWPGSDPFYSDNQAENNARRTYYGVTYVPYVRIDGLISAGSGGPWEQQMLDRQTVDSPLTIALTGSMSTPTVGEIQAEIHNTSGSTVAGTLRFLIIENGCLHNGTYYNAVLREFIPGDATGEAVSIPAGDSITRTAGFLVEAGWNRGNLVALAFVQNDTTREIYQTGRIFFELDEPALLLTRVLIDDSTGGDGNGRLDPGETAAITMEFGNGNPTAATGVTGQLTSTDPRITISDASGSWPDVPPGTMQQNTADPFVVTAAADTPWGLEIPLTLAITAVGYDEAYTLTLPVGSPGHPIGPDAYGYYAYEDGDDYEPSPEYSWFEIDPTLGGSGTLVNLSDDQTGRFNLPFTYRHYGQAFTRVSICSNGWIAFGDQTESSPSNGPIPGPAGPPNMIAAFWDDLNPVAAGSGHIYQYYDAAGHRYIVEWSAVEHYDSGGLGLPETFQFIVHDPAFYPTPTGDGETVIQYALVSDAGACVAGIENGTETIGIQYLANGDLNAAATGLAAGRAIKYTTVQPSSASVEDSPASAKLLLDARPNPMAGNTQIVYRVPIAGDVTLRVFNLEGGLVRTLLDGTVAAGLGVVQWDGRSDRGRPVPAGVYFFQMNGPDFAVSRKVLVQ